MVSLQENHDKREFECFYHSSPSISNSYMPSHFPKQSIPHLPKEIIQQKSTFHTGVEVKYKS